MSAATIPILKSKPSTAVRPQLRGRVLIVEAQTLMAAGLQLALTERQWDVELIEAASECEIIDRVSAFGPDCVLLDIDLGYGLGRGIELIRPISEIGTTVVMLTTERRRAVLAECIEAGAIGWIRKDSPLEEADARLERVVGGAPLLGCTERAELCEVLRADRTKALQAQARFDQLSPRETRVLTALSAGLSAEEIADEDFVALTTVRSQIRSILLKLGVRSQLAAVAIADANREFLPLDQMPGRDRRRRRPRLATAQSS